MAQAHDWSNKPKSATWWIVEGHRVGLRLAGRARS